MKRPPLQPINFILILTAIAVLLAPPSLLAVNIDASGWNDPTVGTWNPVTLTATLTTDLYETIYILADDITLDGSDHFIKTTSWPGPIGVIVEERSNVTIRYLTVDTYSDAAHITDCSNIIIENFAARNGVMFTRTTNSTIDGFLVTYNPWWGVLLTDGSNDNRIANVSDTNDGWTPSDGVKIESSHRNIVESCTFSEAKISLEHANYNTIRNNTITSPSPHSAPGIHLWNSDWNLIENNTLTDAGGFKLGGQWYGSDNNRFVGNTLIDTQYEPVTLDMDCDDNLFEKNIFDGTGRGVVQVFSNTHRNTFFCNNFYNLSEWNGQLLSWASGTGAVNFSIYWYLECPRGGNYYDFWAPYHPDADGDGIVDVQYTEWAFYDPYQLTVPFGCDYVERTPVAMVGPDQTVYEGDPVTLDGTNSSDPNGDALTYEWTQMAGPPVAFDPEDPTPFFTAPDVILGGATLTFQLVVNDGCEDSEPAITNVTVKNINTAPVAVAGDDQTVVEESFVTLDGGGSYDPDGEEITYLWMQIAGSTVTLSDETAPKPDFTAPLVGILGETLTFVLTVTDGEDESSDTVDVFVENVNHDPVANAGNDQTVEELTTVQLNGLDSDDPDSDPLDYTWSQVSGVSVELSDATSATPTFLAPEVDGEDITVVFELRVDDGYGGWDTDQIIVTVQDSNAPPNCSLAQASEDYLWPPNHKMMSIHVMGVTDPDDNDVTITITGVTQDEPVNGLGDGDTSPDAVIQGGTVLLRSERSGTGNGRVYQIEFTADDGAGGVCSGSVSVIVPHNRKKPIQAVDDGQLYISTQE